MQNVNLPFDDESFEIITLLAVLEHLHHPIDMLNEIKRVLVPHGILLLTVPSHAAKPVLEFLSYKLHIISKEEILDHKRYYNKKDIVNSLSQVNGLKLLTHHYFQCGMNNFAKIIKE
ncbi:methyltransferase domain-containing protein [Helicobacter sp. MIT 05-5293]|nr:methyltransferase domain-containing protein [Helicobacter sp. MIT 05-5293]